MGFQEAFAKFREKKKEEKEEFKSMERDIRFKKKLEQKMKSPAQKELEFYNREEAKENLQKLLKQKREKRREKLDRLSNPFNKKCLFSERVQIKDGNLLPSRRTI